MTGRPNFTELHGLRKILLWNGSRSRADTPYRTSIGTVTNHENEGLHEKARTVALTLQSSHFYARYKYLVIGDALLLWLQNLFSFLVDLAVSEPGKRSFPFQCCVLNLPLLAVLPWSTHQSKIRTIEPYR